MMRLEYIDVEALMHWSPNLSDLIDHWLVTVALVFSII